MEGSQRKRERERERPLLPGRKHLAARLSQDRQQLPAPRRTTAGLLSSLTLPHAPWVLSHRLWGFPACPPTLTRQGSGSVPRPWLGLGHSPYSLCQQFPCPKLSLGSFVPAVAVIAVLMQEWCFWHCALNIRTLFYNHWVPFNGASKL